MTRKGAAATPPLRIVSPLHKATRQVSVYLGRLSRADGVEGGDAHLLSYVSVYGPARVGELRAVFGHQPSTLTGVLDRLERAGWLERQVDPRDRRSFLVRATTSGKRKGRHVRRFVEGFEAELLAQVDERDLAGYRRVMDAIAEVTEVELRD